MANTVCENCSIDNKNNKERQTDVNATLLTSIVKIKLEVLNETILRYNNLEFNCAPCVTTRSPGLISLFVLLN